MKIDKRRSTTHYRFEESIILLLLGVSVFFLSATIVRGNLIPHFIAKNILLAIPCATFLILSLSISALLIIGSSIYIAVQIHGENVRKEMIKKEKTISSTDFAPVKVKAINKVVAYSYINPSDLVCVAKEEENGEISYHLTLDTYGKATNHAMFMEAFELL